MPEFGWQAKWDRGWAVHGQPAPDHRVRLAETLGLPGQPTTMDIVVATSGIVLLIEATRRAVGAPRSPARDQRGSTRRAAATVASVVMPKCL